MGGRKEEASSTTAVMNSNKWYSEYDHFTFYVDLHFFKKKIQHSSIYFTWCRSVFFFQEQEENKSATSWPEYYIDQLNLMAAVSSFLVTKLSFRK